MFQGNRIKIILGVIKVYKMSKKSKHFCDNPFIALKEPL